jgi:hypothetical protein
MTRIRMVGVCLVGVFAISAGASASASAELPEFVPENGKYEKRFTSTSTESYIEASGQRIVVCQVSENAGTLHLAKLLSVHARFTGCVSPVLHVSCQTTGAGEPGVILTKQLKGTVGYINKITKEVGLSLTPPVAGGPLMVFKCGPVAVKIGEGTVAEGGKMGGDSVIAQLGPINLSRTKYGAEFHCEGGKQQVEKLEEGLRDVLEAKQGNGPWEEACLNYQDRLTFSENVTLAA